MTVSMSSFFAGGNLGKGGDASLTNRPAGSGAIGGGVGGYQSIASTAFDAAGEIGDPKIDPETGSSRMMGIAGGAAAGSIFGPVGAVVGGVIGALGFLDSSSSGERMRAKRTATQQSYASGQAAYDYVNTNTKTINETYQTDLASGRARLAGQGIEVEGSSQWEQLQGSLSKKRTDALAGLDQEMADFRATDAMKWVGEDYDYQMRVTIANPGHHATKGRDATPARYKIGPKEYGRSNVKMFTDAQRKNIRSGGDRKTMNKYAAMLAPGQAAYEKGTFGSAADKAAFSANVDARIATANTWYDRKAKEDSIKAANRQARQDRQNQRGR